MNLSIGRVWDTGQAERRRTRTYERRYAKRHGYYWLPCPLCGDEFGGHEAHGSIPTAEPNTYEHICPACTAERQRTAERHLAQIGETVQFDGTRWGWPHGVHHDIPHSVEHGGN